MTLTDLGAEPSPCYAHIWKEDSDSGTAGQLSCWHTGHQGPCSVGRVKGHTSILDQCLVKSTLNLPTPNTGLWHLTFFRQAQILQGFVQVPSCGDSSDVPIGAH